MQQPQGRVRQVPRGGCAARFSGELSQLAGAARCCRGPPALLPPRRCLLAASCAAQVSVAVVAKELGARWKALTDAQRQLYKNIAAANKAADQADKQRAAEDGGGEEAQDAAGAAQQGTGLPISVVKRIIMCDTEVRVPQC